jgi:hypothetical protein
MSNEELSLSQARKLAKYYGKIVRKHDEVVITEKEKMQDIECLSYCRSIILKKSRKSV